MDENKLLDLKFSQTNIVYKDAILMAIYMGNMSAQFNKKFSAVTSSKAFSVIADQRIKHF